MGFVDTFIALGVDSNDAIHAETLSRQAIMEDILPRFTFPN